MDYFFLEGEDMAAAENLMFVMVDEDKGNRYACLTEHRHGRRQQRLVDYGCG